MGDKSGNGANKVQTDNVLESTPHIEPADAISNLMSSSTPYFCILAFRISLSISSPISSVASAPRM